MLRWRAKSRLWDWWPSVTTGLLQTEDYARALINVVPGTTPRTAVTRLANRMEPKFYARRDAEQGWNRGALQAMIAGRLHERTRSRR